MITRRLVRTRQLQPGMKIDQAVVDKSGRNLVQRGSILDNYVIDSLLKMGVMMVYIQSGEETAGDIEKSISPQAYSLYIPTLSPKNLLIQPII